MTVELAWPKDAERLHGPVPDNLKGQDRIAWTRARENLYRLESDLFPSDEEP